MAKKKKEKKMDRFHFLYCSFPNHDHITSTSVLNAVDLDTLLEKTDMENYEHFLQKAKETDEISGLCLRSENKSCCKLTRKDPRFPA